MARLVVHLKLLYKEFNIMINILFIGCLQQKIGRLIKFQSKKFKKPKSKTIIRISLVLK
jgi:hypothetical protein